MKWLALVCALGACDQVFGLHATRGLDAAYFDAPVDAPYACPPIGTPPAFSAGLREQLAQACGSYTLGAGHAMAQCPDGSAIYYGPATGPLEKAIVALDAPTEQVNYMRLAPEGDHAIASIYDQSANEYHIELFQLMGDNAWHDVHLIVTLQPSGLIDYPQISTPSSEPGAHVLVIRYDLYPMPGRLYEMVDDGNPDPSQPWRQASVQTFDPATLDVVNGFSMTPDGLRQVFFSQQTSGAGIYYQDRATIDGSFSTPTIVPGLPQTSSSDPFMTEDCARVFVSGLGGVFYATQ